MGISLLIISYGIFQGIFILIYFISTNKLKKSQKFFSILLILSILILCIDYVLSNYFILYTEKVFIGIGWSVSFWLFIVPVYYLLSYSFLTGNSPKFQIIVGHFSPFILSLAYNFPFFILPADMRQEYLMAYSLGSDPSYLHILSKGIYHVQLLIYPLMILKIIKQKKLSVFNSVSILNFCLLALGIGSFIHLLVFNFFGLSISWFTSTFIFISLTFFIHLTAYALMIRPEWIYNHIDEIMSKYTSSNLKNVDLERIQNDLKVLMQTEKVYLEPKLSLSKLAELLSLTPHQLSEYLNQKNAQNFQNFINSHRVMEAKELLIDPGNRIFTIDAIALKVGFKSSATFYRSFKKYTGVSPIAWIEQDLLNKE